MVDGGAGEDDLSYLGAPTGVTVDLGRAGPQDTGGAGVDTIAEIENIEGTDHADTLTGNAGFNYVISNGGDDLLDGAAGDDAITGGDGNDAVTYARAPGAVTVDLSASSGTGYGNDGIAEVESVIGSPFDDRLVGNRRVKLDHRPRRHRLDQRPRRRRHGRRPRRRAPTPRAAAPRSTPPRPISRRWTRSIRTARPSTSCRPTRSRRRRGASPRAHRQAQAARAEASRRRGRGELPARGLHRDRDGQAQRPRTQGARSAEAGHGRALGRDRPAARAGADEEGPASVEGRASRRRKPPKLAITVAATDVAGNDTTRALTVRAKGPAK